LSSRVTSAVLRYGLAVVSVAMALGVAFLARSVGVEKVEVPLLLLAVAITVWNAGLLPGLVSGGLAGLGFDYFFTEPFYTHLKLPKVDGLQVLKQIKSDENLRMIPVVVLTSSREERDMVESYRLGVNAYVVKPVDFHEFVNAIKELGVFWAVINQPPPGSIRRGPQT
jgi:CheY-like chemotaxis protein